MGLRTSIVVAVVGLILALAVTLQVQRVDLSAVGVSLIVGAAAGGIITAVQRTRHQPYAEWFATGPWLLIVGLVMTQAIDLPQVTGVDLFTVGLIVLVVGVLLTLVALYIVSPLRVSKSVRSAWSGDTAPDDYAPPVRHVEPYSTPQLPSSDPSRTYEGPTQPVHRSGYDDGSAYGSSSISDPTQTFGDRTTPPQREQGKGYDDRPEYRTDGGEPPTQQLPRS